MIIVVQPNGSDFNTPHPPEVVSVNVANLNISPVHSRSKAK